MVVRKFVAAESKVVTWQVGCDGFGFEFEAVYETTNQQRAFSVCSWLNGGVRPTWLVLSDMVDS